MQAALGCWRGEMAAAEAATAVRGSATRVGNNIVGDWIVDAGEAVKTYVRDRARPARWAPFQRGLKLRGFIYLNPCEYLEATVEIMILLVSLLEIETIRRPIVYHTRSRHVGRHELK